jgi:hypothetical protein
MANERLAEIALTDPKRVKRCAFLHILGKFLSFPKNGHSDLRFFFQDSGESAVSSQVKGAQDEVHSGA